MDVQNIHPKNWIGQPQDKTIVIHLDNEAWQKFVPISDHMQKSPSQLGHLLLKQGLLQYQQKGKIKSEKVGYLMPKSITKRLTSREIEILKSAAQETSNKAMASCLGIREQTTKNHFSAILHKLNGQNRIKAVILAFAQNLIQKINCLNDWNGNQDSVMTVQ